MVKLHTHRHSSRSDASSFRYWHPVAKAFVKDRSVPDDWQCSLLLPIFKGKIFIKKFCRWCFFCVCWHKKCQPGVCHVNRCVWTGCTLACFDWRSQADMLIAVKPKSLFLKLYYTYHSRSCGFLINTRELWFIFLLATTMPVGSLILMYRRNDSLCRHCSEESETSLVFHLLLCC